MPRPSSTSPVSDRPAGTSAVEWNVMRTRRVSASPAVTVHSTIPPVALDAVRVHVVVVPDRATVQPVPLAVTVVVPVTVNSSLYSEPAVPRPSSTSPVSDRSRAGGRNVTVTRCETIWPAVTVHCEMPPDGGAVTVSVHDDEPDGVLAREQPDPETVTCDVPPTENWSV